MNAPAGKPRGVLHPQLAQGRFQHERQLPSAPLTELVEHYWFVRWDLRGVPPQQQATLPHPNVHLVVEHGDAQVYGVHTDRFERRLEGLDFAFGVKFKAAGFQPFLRAPVATLANRAMPAHAIFGDEARTLVRRIAPDDGADDMAAMCAVANDFLLARLPPPDPDVARANALVAAIAADLGMTSVERLMATAAMDKRAVQRLFQKYVGIGPKWVIKRYRLHEAIAQMQDGAAVSWTTLAQELGYYDQAHFGRDFRALVGQSPSEYARMLADAARASSAK